MKTMLANDENAAQDLIAKPRQALGGRGVNLHKFDLIAGEWRLRQHLSYTGQCIPEGKWHPH